MKRINMPMDELDSLLDKLYDACECEDAYFVVKPKQGIIEVFETDKGQSYQVAEIKLIEIDDAYDVVREIFNNQ